MATRSAPRARRARVDRAPSPPLRSKGPVDAAADADAANPVLQAYKSIGTNAVLLALCWGATFEACDLYYRNLGTTPGEVGLSVKEVFANVVLVLLTFTPAGLFSLAISDRVRRRFEITEGAPLASALFFGLVWLLARSADNAYVVPTMVVLGAVVVLLPLLEPKWPGAALLAAPLKRLLTALGVAILLAFVSLLVYVPREARNMDAAGRPQGVSSVLNLRAWPVCAAPFDDSLTTRYPGALLLLGSSNGVAVLRDPRRNDTIRVPLTSYELRSVAGTHVRCKPNP